MLVRFVPHLFFFFKFFYSVLINNITQLAYKENAQKKKKKMKFDNGTLFWDVSFFSGVHARE